MISLAEARALIAEKILPLPAQTTALEMASGRVLRENIRADEDMPAFDRSAMDGYAVGVDDRSAYPRTKDSVELNTQAIWARLDDASLGVPIGKGTSGELDDPRVCQ